MLRIWMFLAASLLMFNGILCAQEQPLTIKSTFSSGFYSAHTRGGGSGDQNIHFVPVSAVCDINGYYLTPDLLDLWVQPELDAAPQASEAGFQGGNGVRMRATMLRQTNFPVTFRYSNVQLEDVYFGSLSRVSSYTLRNRNKDLGLTTELKHSGLPPVMIDWGTGSVNSTSGAAAVSGYQSTTQHLNVESKFVRWGWDFQTFAHHQRQTSDLLVPVDQGANTSALEQNVTQFQGSGRRSLPRSSELYMDAGSESTANLLLGRPIDLTTRYASANLRLLQRKKWKTSLRAGYTSNIAGLLLNQLIGSLAGSGSVAPQASVLQPLQRTISNLSFNALTSVDLSHGLSLYGNMDRTAVLAGGDSGLSSSYLTMSGGVAYMRKYGWGNLSGQYGRDIGIGSVTGQSGTIQGQNSMVTVQHGTRDGLQLDFSVHATDQSVHSAKPTDNHSLAFDGSLAHRVFGQLSARVGGGWQQNAFTNAGSDFRTSTYTSHAGIEHPRFQLNASLNGSVGNSLQAYSQTLGGIAAESALLNPAHLVASDLRGTSFSLHANPIAKLELSGFWTRSLQHLEGVVANNFEVVDAHATYHFRRIQLEAGFFRSSQTFSSYLATYPETQRGRFYIRVSRSGRLL